MRNNQNLIVGNVTSFKEVQKKIVAVHKFLHKHPSPENWIIFPIQTIQFKKALTEKQAEKKFNIRFCNGISDKLESAQLCYSSYDGLLSIIPNSNKNEESFCNPVTQTDDMDSGTCDKMIWKLWKELVMGYSGTDLRLSRKAWGEINQ